MQTPNAVSAQTEGRVQNTKEAKQMSMRETDKARLDAMADLIERCGHSSVRDHDGIIINDDSTMCHWTLPNKDSIEVEYVPSIGKWNVGVWQYPVSMTWGVTEEPIDTESVPSVVLGILKEGKI